jgi:hypothetical protein
MCCCVGLVCVDVFKNFNFQIRDLKQNMEFPVVINDRTKCIYSVISSGLYCSF